jgi:hypothetical protein
VVFPTAEAGIRKKVGGIGFDWVCFFELGRGHLFSLPFAAQAFALVLSFRKLALFCIIQAMILWQIGPKGVSP